MGIKSKIVVIGFIAEPICETTLMSMDDMMLVLVEREYVELRSPRSDVGGTRLSFLPKISLNYFLQRSPATLLHVAKTTYPRHGSQ